MHTPTDLAGAVVQPGRLAVGAGAVVVGLEALSIRGPVGAVLGGEAANVYVYFLFRSYIVYRVYTYIYLYYWNIRGPVEWAVLGGEAAYVYAYLGFISCSVAQYEYGIRYGYGACMCAI